jgi:NAD(P)H-dependent FMN reductase
MGVVVLAISDSLKSGVHPQRWRTGNHAARIDIREGRTPPAALQYPVEGKKKENMTARFLAFAGSTRRDSFNKKLVRIAAQGAEEVGAKVTLIDLRDFPLPLFDGDLEAAEGQPESAKKLKALMTEHDGFLIASPEYNSSFSGVLKNAIDWVSRPSSNELPLVAFKGKVAVLMSASPGGLGGLRGLVHVRSILGNIGVIVLPDQIAVVKASEAFNADGSLKDPKQHAAVMGLGKTLASFLDKMKA